MSLELIETEIEKKAESQTTLVKEIEKTEADESSKFRMVFEGAVATKLMGLSTQLRKRGVDGRALSQLLSDVLLEKPESFWEKWLDDVTPGHFYLQAIQKDPDLQAKLEKVLKQMYLGRGKVQPSKKKSQLSDEEVEGDLELSAGSA